jgi:MarR family transcriptional regulator for hemolysin
MADTLNLCARELLEVMPLAMQDLRRTMRGHSSPDLRFPELRSLAFLRHNPGSNLTDLAEFIGVSLPSMSKLVDSLTYRGFIDRQPDAEDRRRVRLGLTEAGREVLTTALDAVKASFAAKLTMLDPQDIALVHKGLQLLHPLFAATAGGDETPPGSATTVS